MRLLTIEQIFSKENMEYAVRRVIHRSHGAKRAEAVEFGEYWNIYGESLQADIIKGKYHSAPYMGVRIPKRGGSGIRMLSIPTTRDKILQLATEVKLAEYYDPLFHRCSFGFRKHCSVYKALKQCLKHINSGMEYVADLDIEGFFDNIEHNILEQILVETIQDKRIIKWVCNIVKAGTYLNGTVVRAKKGISQGSPLSPLLANVVLNELDWYLHEQHVLFVRYADDVILFCKCRREAEQALRNVHSYMTEKLKLKINWSKTYMMPVDKIEYLGYQFRITNYGCQLKIGDNRQKELFYKIRQYVDVPFDKPVEWWNRLGSFNRGWINYYQNAERKTLLPVIQQMDAIEQKEIQKKMQELHKNRKRYYYKTQNSIYKSSFVSNEAWYEDVMRRRTRRG